MSHKNINSLHTSKKVCLYVHSVAAVTLFPDSQVAAPSHH